jgi:hypothetical protein
MVEDFQGLCSGDLNGDYPVPFGGFTNDDCANAYTINCGDDVFGNTLSATIDGPATTCDGGSVAPDVWYLFTGTGDLITASMCGGGTDYDSKIDIYTGTCGALVSVDCNDDYCGAVSEISWTSDIGTDYYIRVHGYSGAVGNYELTITCAAAPLYCTVAGGTSFEYISNVTVGTINNDSGNSAYEDYTAISTDMSIGVGTYPFSLTVSGAYSTDISAVYVDWNQDNVFDEATERVDCSPVGGATQTCTITVPAGATLGTTRMRVIMMDGSVNTMSACGSFSYGDAEDYTINVIP